MCPRVSIAKDSLRHNETIVKPTVDRRTTGRRTPISHHASIGKISQVTTWIPTYELPKLSGYAIWCWGYREAQISHTTNKSYTPTVSIRQHITKKTSEIVYLRPSKTSNIIVMAIHLIALPSIGCRQTTLTIKNIEAFSMSASFGITELKL